MIFLKLYLTIWTLTNLTLSVSFDFIWNIFVRLKICSICVGAIGPPRGKTLNIKGLGQQRSLQSTRITIPKGWVSMIGRGSFYAATRAIVSALDNAEIWFLCVRNINLEQSYIISQNPVCLPKDGGCSFL